MTVVHKLGSVYCGFAFIFLNYLKLLAFQMCTLICSSGGELSDPEDPFSSHVHNLFLHHIIK